VTPRTKRSALKLRLAGFRYPPAIGGAEQYARRLLQELGGRVDADVVTLAAANRTSWLPTLVEGVRERDEEYEVDGRRVLALGRWPAAARLRLRALAPLYHLPASPAPTLMGRVLAPQLRRVAEGAGVLHNVFMGREAFSLGLRLAAADAGVPFVFTPLRHERPLGWSSGAFRQLYRTSEAVVALTAVERDWLVARGARPERTRVVGIGPLAAAGASPEPARRAAGWEGKLVLFLGQLHEYKGFRALIRAADLLRERDDVRFVFAGPDVRGGARAFAEAPPNVRYLGAVGDELRDSLFSACTVLCVPSSRESFGIVLVDAWASGKPVIGGPAAATRELIEDGVDGWAVAQDPLAIARRVAQLLDDGALARRMGECGRRKVEARFTWARIAQAHLDLYRELLEEAGA
jgi:glycosyltransferase involved in cell wall biosynthesis